MGSCADACAPESLAERELSAQGYEVFLPRFLKRWRHARRVELACGAFICALCFCAL